MALYAWRWWTTSLSPFFPDNLSLRGAYGVKWPVGAPLHATCSSIEFISDENGCSARFVKSTWHNRNGITSPDTQCHCGIYALKHPGKSADVFPENANVVLGIAEIWGKIITATLGYRAEYGQIRAVIDDKQVASTYGIPSLLSAEDAYAEYFESGKERV